MIKSSRSTGDLSFNARKILHQHILHFTSCRAGDRRTGAHRGTGRPIPPLSNLRRWPRERLRQWMPSTKVIMRRPSRAWRSSPRWPLELPVASQPVRSVLLRRTAARRYRALQQGLEDETRAGLRSLLSGDQPRGKVENAKRRCRLLLKRITRVCPIGGSSALWGLPAPGALP